MEFSPLEITQREFGRKLRGYDPEEVQTFLEQVAEEMTRLLQEAVQFQAPRRSGMYRPKMRYAHQGGSNPPIVVIHGNALSNIPDTYRRFLEGRFREAFQLKGTPLRIEFRTNKNPYAQSNE